MDNQDASGRTLSVCGSISSVTCSFGMTGIVVKKGFGPERIGGGECVGEGEVKC